MEFWTNNVPEIIQIALQAVGLFALIATVTPNETDNKVADILMKVINFVGANWGNAANDPNAGRTIKR